ncbi:GNAT family protein [Clostridium sp.]|uniref:GNAT family N-acetyltransferase n=1 Tax=Clostridium sp. TaxID=1506 RepID=UPI0025C3F904|nr:GNAT family protein [Clostridium sp.]
MSIRIIPINEKDRYDLLKFEIDNRSFFEESCISRGDKYYEEDNFKEILKELIKEQEQGIHYMYLIKDNNDEIVGRINLVEIIRGNMNKAELGYRIAKAHNGKGYGKKAVELILGEALNIHKLHRIEAGTAIENIASQKVLEFSGFRKVGIYNKCIYVNGKWNDSVIYEVVLD